MLRISPLLDVALSVCASLFCLLSMPLPCVCALLSFCISAFFPFSPAFLFFLCVLPSYFIEGSREAVPYSSLNWSDHGAVFVSFSSTMPNFMLSHDPLFSFFLFSLFRYFFKLLLFSLWQPIFTKPPPSLSGGDTSLSLFLFYLFFI